MRIAIYHDAIREYTYESTHERAIGGTEFAVATLAEILSLMGHDVQVYSKGGEQSEYPNWHGLDDYSPGSYFDVMLAVDNFSPMLLEGHGVNYVWLHNPPEIYKDLIRKPLPGQEEYSWKYLAVSHFHRDAFKEMYGSECPEIGVLHDPIPFDGIKMKAASSDTITGRKVINISRPERSLPFMLDIIEEVQKTNPEIEFIQCSYDLNAGGYDPLGLTTSTGDISINAGAIYKRLKKLNVTVLPPQPHEQLWQLLAGCRVMASPMEGYGESFGLAQAEAATLGVRVVASAIGNTPTLLNHWDGATLLKSKPGTKQGIKTFARQIIKAAMKDVPAYGYPEQHRQYDPGQVAMTLIAKAVMEIRHDVVIHTNSNTVAIEMDGAAMGGSESALYNVSHEMAKDRSVLVVGNAQDGARGMLTYIDGTWIDMRRLRAKTFISFRDPRVNRDSIGEAEKTILWSEDDTDQPVLEKLEAHADKFDQIWALSDYHKKQIFSRIVNVGLTPDMIRLTTNGVDEFMRSQILMEKPQKDPKYAVYTSAPYRGLDKLLEIAPELHRATGITIGVFSSMATYRMEDNAEIQALLNMAAKTEGIKMVGSVSRAELANHLAIASYFIYPNTFPETCCSAVIEAMAFGCIPIVTDLGALPEKVDNDVTGIVTSSVPASFVSAVKALDRNEDTAALMRDAAMRKARMEWDYGHIVAGMLGYVDSTAFADTVANTPEIPKEERGHNIRQLALDENMKLPSGLSVCIIAYDEEDFITDTIQSAQNVADEIIVLDTGSRDNTKQIAADLGALVFEYKDEFRFDRCKNKCISLANYRYVMILDADEVIHPRDYDGVKYVAANEEFDAFEIMQENLTNAAGTSGIRDIRPDEEKVAFGAKYSDPTKIIRIFRNMPTLIYHEFPVHEVVLPSIMRAGLTYGHADLHIYNRGAIEPQDKQDARRNQYLKLGQEKIAENQDNDHHWYELGIEYKHHGKHAEAVECFDKAIAIDPNEPKYWMNCGVALVEEKRLIEALAYYSRSFGYDSHKSDSANNMGVIYYAMGRYDLAKHWFAEALLANPDNEMAADNFKLCEENGA